MMVKMMRPSATIGIGWRIGGVVGLAVLGLLLGVLGLQTPAAAQSTGELWTAPVNLSKSGAATQPVIAAAPDGRLHVLWWDTVAGEHYARMTDSTGLRWTSPVTVPFMWGQRKAEKDTVTGKEIVTFDPPYELQLLADASGTLHAFWRNADNALTGVQTQGTDWGTPEVLAESMAGAQAVADGQGAVHLAYVHLDEQSDAPAGIYYRRTSATGWSKPTLVYASLYFRIAKPGQVHLSVAVNGAGQIVILWDDLDVGQSVYVRSTDGGFSWTSPAPVSNDPTLPAALSNVAATPNGDFLIFWKEVSVAGCGVRWLRSADGGQTWSAPARIYSDFSYCPSHMRFPLVSGVPSWRLGLLSVEGANVSGALVTLVGWDGQRWSPPAEVGTDFRDKAANRDVHLRGDSLDIAMTGEAVGLVGTDLDGDVWAMRNAAPPDQLVPWTASAWDVPKILSNTQGLAQVKAVPALLAAPDGKVYAAWSEAPALTSPGTALYLAVQTAGRWSRPIQVVPSQGDTASSASASPASAIAEQPALALDGHDRLHALWRGGARADILYSWTFATDATVPATWAEPRAVPMPGQPASWPDMVVGPHDDTLRVVYAVPYNEGRGVHYLQSTDGGATWSTPTTIFDAVAAQADSVDKPRLAFDADYNTLHAVWLKTGLIGETPGQAVMYARSTDAGLTWSTPVTLTLGTTDWPRVAVAAPGQIFVVWNYAEAGTSADLFKVGGQFSTDGGLHWAETQPLPGVQVTGATGLTSDGGGGLHLVGAGQSATGEATLLYARWEGQAWSPLEVFSLGREATAGNAAAVGAVPTSSQLAVMLRMFLVPANGPGMFQIMTTGRSYPASQPAKPYPTFTPLPLPTATATPAPLPTMTALPQLNNTGLPKNLNSSPIPISLSLMVGIGLVVLLIGGATVIKLLRR